MHVLRNTATLGCAVALIVGANIASLTRIAVASDHQDTIDLATNRPGADISDVFVFPAADPAKVVLVMDVHPLIPGGQGPATAFDPGVMYQFHIAHGHNNYTSDEVIQFKASGTGADQKITMYGPAMSTATGTTSQWVSETGSAPYDKPTPIGSKGAMLYAGPRQDPFYFDLTRFLAIVPDRDYKNQPNPPAASATCYRTPGDDFFAPFNVLSIVAELPRTMLADASGHAGVIHVWATTSIAGAGSETYTQIERLARPAVKEGTELFRNHDATNRVTPTNDGVLASSIYQFARTTAHRSDATAKALVKVLIPDEIEADLNAKGPASYLAVETNGKSGLPTGAVRVVPSNGLQGLKKSLTNPERRFGGRDLSSPVMDVSLGAIFGSLVSKLGLAPDDHKETPCLTSDNVKAPARGITASFPYVGPAI